MRDTGARVEGLRAVITTAEALDRPTRGLFAATFGADVYDVYGLTEMGTVAWECSHHTGLHVSEDIVLVERGDGMESDREAPMIMTSLELTAMPLIRYQTGDVAEAPHSEPCPCGRVFHRIPHVSGRMVDCLRLPGGRLLSPYSVTLALESVQGLDRYQVLQERADALRRNAGGWRLGEHAPALVPEGHVERARGPDVPPDVGEDRDFEPAWNHEASTDEHRPWGAGAGCSSRRASCR